MTLSDLNFSIMFLYLSETGKIMLYLAKWAEIYSLGTISLSSESDNHKHISS